MTEPSPTYAELDRMESPQGLYDRAMEPHRGGILSDRGLTDPKLSKKRLLVHARAVAWQLHHMAEDVASWRDWGRREATEAQRLRDRVVLLFSILTDEQKAFMRERDEKVRAANGGQLLS